MHLKPRISRFSLPIIFCLLVFSQLTASASQLTASAPYVVTDLPNYDSSLNPMLSIKNATAFINDRYLIFGQSFFEDVNRKRQKVINLYDTETFELETIIRGDEQIGSEAGFSDSSDFASDNSTAFVAMDGDLFAISNNGSDIELLGSFGTFGCCGTGFSNFNRISMLDIINGELYFTAIDELETNGQGQSPTSFSLWKTDGTVAGTRQLSIRHGSISHVLINNDFSKNSVFYLADGDLWLVTDNQRSTKVQDLNSSFIGATATNSRGVFVCSNDGSQGLWRLGNNGGFERVSSSKCDNLSLKQQGDNLYFITSKGLEHSTGLTNDSTLILAAQPEGFDEGGACVIDNTLYTTLTKRDPQTRFGQNTLLLGVSSTQVVSDLTSLFNPEIDGISIQACLKDGILVAAFTRSEPDEADRTYDQYYYYQPQQNALNPIRQGINTIGGRSFSDQSRLTIQGSEREDLIFVSDQMFYLREQNLGFMGSIIEMLDD